MRRVRMINTGTSSGSALGFTGTVDEVAAAGTTQEDATKVSGDCVVVTSASVGGGIIIAGELSPGDIIFIQNLSGSSFSVYPPNGAKFNRLSINAPFAFSSLRSMMVVFVRADGANLCYGSM